VRFSNADEFFRKVAAERADAREAGEEPSVDFPVGDLEPEGRSTRSSTATPAREPNATAASDSSRPAARVSAPRAKTSKARAGNA